MEWWSYGAVAESFTSLLQDSNALLLRLANGVTQRAIQIVFDSVQNAVDETAGFAAAESLGEFDGLVDGDDRRDVVAIKHFVDGEPQHIAIDRGDAVEFVILAIAPDALVDLWQMRDHSFDERLGEFAHGRFHGAKFEEIVDAFRLISTLEVAPKMILDGRFAGSAPFAHKLLTAEIRHDIGDLHRGARRLGPAVDFIFQATLARLSFVVETEHGVDHRYALIDGDALQGIGHRAAEVFGMGRFAFCKITPQAMIASGFACSASSRTTTGISNAPGTRSREIAAPATRARNSADA